MEGAPGSVTRRLTNAFYDQHYPQIKLQILIFPQTYRYISPSALQTASATIFPSIIFAQGIQIKKDQDPRSQDCISLLFFTASPY